MLTDDARAWLRDLVAMPEEDAAAEIAARLLGEREAAYRAGAAEMAPAVRNGERDAVVRLLRQEMVGAGPLVRRTLEHVEQAVVADVHRGVGVSPRVTLSDGVEPVAAVVGAPGAVVSLGPADTYEPRPVLCLQPMTAADARYQAPAPGETVRLYGRRR